MGLGAIFKGWTGELKTKFTNSVFLDERYRVFNNVIISASQGSTQIDHVIVSRYGVFSIETKDKSGWIFGGERQERWTQDRYGKKDHFQNPLRQNYLHTKSLSEFLGIDHHSIHSVVIFWGDCEFKTPMPDGVFKGDVFGGKFKEYVRGKTAVLLAEDQVDRICAELKRAKDNAGFLCGLEHAKRVHDRFASHTVCPKCGKPLVKRVAHAGPNQGKPFLGCSNYPRCKYIKDL